MTDVKALAQDWHEAAHGDDPVNGHCWCCCNRCDPDYEDDPNPYWTPATPRSES